MGDTDLKRRTKRFALEVIKFIESLPNDETQHERSLQSEGVKPVMQPHKGR